MACHPLLQGIFPTQRSNPGLLHCKQSLYWLSHQDYLNYQNNININNNSWQLLGGFSRALMCLSVNSKSSTGRQGLLWSCFKELTEVGQVGLVLALICSRVGSRWWGPYLRHSDGLSWKWDSQTSSINNTCEFIKNVIYWAFSSFFVWFLCIRHVEYSSTVVLEPMFSIPVERFSSFNEFLRLSGALPNWPWLVMWLSPHSLAPTPHYVQAHPSCAKSRPRKRNAKKAKWLSEEALQIAE